MFFFFFFSSRRRHTRSLRDWSSDVCSSDLGYHAIEVAKLGFTVTGLDISATMVEIATDGASRAGVRAEFRRGDASAMPFEDGSFDVVVCQAAFKNFRRPVTALNEMHRVLRPGGVAVVQDMNHDATA